MIVKNESRCLARCLKSVANTVNEMVVVDTGSTDSTVQIAQDMEAKVFDFKWIDDFSAARNFSLEKTTGDWILVLDADEYATSALASEMVRFINGPEKIGRLKIVSEFRKNGQLMRSQGFVSRLFPRGAQFAGRIHEQLVSPLPRVCLEAELLHDGYLETTKSDRNVRLLLRELEREPKNAHYLFQLGVEYSSLGKIDKAFECLEKAYIFVGSNDAFAPNIVVDFLHAILELKRYETGLKVIQESEKSLADFPDFHFVCGMFYMNLVKSDPAKNIAFLPKIEACYKRCIALGDTNHYKSVRGTGSFLAYYNLGVLYHVFGNKTAACHCLEEAAKAGHEPSIQLLNQIRK